MKRIMFNGSDQVRIDLAITNELEQRGEPLSRSQIQKLIERQLVTVNGKVCTRPGFRLVDADKVEVIIEELLPEYKPSELSQNIPIVFMDDHIIVINKPAGISVHPGIGTKGNTVVEGLIHHLSSIGSDIAENPRLGVVHRIDKETTGLLVLARTTDALTVLSKQFAEKTAQRSYSALVLTSPRGKRRVQMDPIGSIVTGFGRHPKNRLKFSVIPESTRLAETHWELIDDIGYGSCLEITLKTGRTHQIRVHMEHLGSPVIGDQLYGDFSALPPELRKRIQEFNRQALHASKLELTHPLSGERLTFTAPLPRDHSNLIDIFRHFQAHGG
jgi:23S rRNA pseudouridine1911/1915/1917 synthase